MLVLDLTELGLVSLTFLDDGSMTTSFHSRALELLQQVGV